MNDHVILRDRDAAFESRFAIGGNLYRKPGIASRELSLQILLCLTTSGRSQARQKTRSRQFMSKATPDISRKDATNAM
jgi:hypothetical protein